MSKNIISQEYTQLLSDLKARVASSRVKAALSLNKELILLYHHIGTQILESQAKLGWGTKIIEQLSRDLKSEFPEMKGFNGTFSWIGWLVYNIERSCVLGESEHKNVGIEQVNQTLATILQLHTLMPEVIKKMGNL